MLFSKIDKEIRYGVTKNIQYQLKNSGALVVMSLMHVGLVVASEVTGSYDSLFINFGLIFMSAYILALITKNTMSVLNGKGDMVNSRLSESNAFKRFIKFSKIGFLALLIVDLVLLYTGQSTKSVVINEEPLLVESVVQENQLLSLFIMASVNAVVASFFLGLVNAINFLIAIRLLEKDNHRDLRLENPASDLHYTLQSMFFGAKCCILPVFIVTLAALTIEYAGGWGLNMLYLKTVSFVVVSYIGTIYAANHYFCVLRHMRS